MIAGEHTIKSFSHEIQALSPAAHGMAAKVVTLKNTLVVHGQEIDQDRDVLEYLKSTSPSVAGTLDQQIIATRKAFQADCLRLEEEFHQQISLQKQENQRIQQQITTLKAEKTSVHQQVLAIQRRVEELEEEIGQD